MALAREGEQPRATERILPRMSEPEPHGELEQLAPGLHVVDGEWGPLRRRMTVMDTGAGLAVHSAMRLGAGEMARLDALGPVRWILVPNRYHETDASWYATRYPQARMLVPSRARASLEKARVGPIAGTHEEDWQELAAAGALERQALDGLRLLHEVVFLHRPSRTLVLCDLAFNFPAADLPWFFRQVMRLNGAVDRFGPTRFFRWFVVRDRRALATSLAPVLAWDFDRIVVSHGRVLVTGGKEAMRGAVGSW